MELRKVINVLKKRWMIILILVMLSLLASIILSFFILDEIYESTATAIVITPSSNEDESHLTYDDYILNTKLVNSYCVLCKTNHVLRQVINQLNLHLTVAELANKVTVTSQEGTEFLHIIVEDSNPTLAMNIANSVATIFQQEVVNTTKRNNVQIFDKATEPTHPISPNKPMNIILSTMAGIALGIGLSFFLEYLDVSIKSVDEIEELLQIPVLGTVPHISTMTWGQS